MTPILENFMPFNMSNGLQQGLRQILVIIELSLELLKQQQQNLPQDILMSFEFFSLILCSSCSCLFLLILHPRCNYYSFIDLPLKNKRVLMLL